MSIEITGIFAGIVKKDKGANQVKSAVPYWLRPSVRKALGKLKKRTNSKDYDELFGNMVAAINKGLDMSEREK